MEDQLAQIPTLKWLPWIGENYTATRNSGNALLVVAESHYEWDEEGARDDLEDRRFTRWFIQENGIDKPKQYRPVLRNLEKAIYNSYPSDTEVVNFWRKSAYYNFIQRVLDSNYHRPVPDDYAPGWENFFSVIGVLKPNYCLFAGVGATDWVYCFNQAANSQNFEIDPFRQLPKIGTCYPRIGSIRSKDGVSTQLVAIRHPSSYFSSDTWAAFLEEQMPNYIKWVRVARQF